MSEGIIFSVGAVVFMMTVWGSVMATGVWLGRVQESEQDLDPSSQPRDDRPGAT